MAREPEFYVGSDLVPNVLEVQFNLRNEADKDGRPTRKQYFEGITVRRIGDENTILMDWARIPWSDNRKDGHIDFKETMTGETMKTLTFSGAYLKSYRVDYDEMEDHVEEIIEIQPEKVDVGGLELDFNWPDV